MYRISDAPSKSDLAKSIPTSSDESSNPEQKLNSFKDLEVCMQNIQSNLKMLNDDRFHNYGVSASSGQKSRLQGFSELKDEQEMGTNYQLSNYSSRQNFETTNLEQLVEEKNRQIRELSREVNELKQGQNKSQAFANYQRIIDNLRRESAQNNDGLIEAYRSKLNEIQCQMNEKDQVIEQLQDQVRFEQSASREGEERVQLLQNKCGLLKQELDRLRSSEDEYGQAYGNLRGQNEQLKRVIEEMQMDLSQRNEQQLSKQQNSNSQMMTVNSLIESVMSTIVGFMEKYVEQMQTSQEYQLKQSGELRRLMSVFINGPQEITVIQSIERISSLVMSLFEQVQYDFQWMYENCQKQQLMHQQIVSLEQMSVNLEHELSQCENALKEQTQRLVVQDSEKEKRGIVDELSRENQKQSELNQLNKDLKLAQQQINEMSEQMGVLRVQNQELSNEMERSRRFTDENDQRVRLNEFRVRKLYGDTLFYKEIVGRISQIVMMERGDLCELVQGLMESHQQLSVCQNDEMEIKSQLEKQEMDLRVQINNGELSMRDMIEKRRDVEVLRGSLRNCNKQMECLREKMQLNFNDLETIVIVNQHSSTQQFSFPKSTKENNHSLSNSNFIPKKISLFDKLNQLK